jgi:hypothetical protein
MQSAADKAAPFSEVAALCARLAGLQKRLDKILNRPNFKA